MSMAQIKTNAFLGLGSNLGDSMVLMTQAIALISQSELTQVMQQSSWYKTAPQEVTEQPDFINGVIQIETGLNADQLLARCQFIELYLGRVRSGERYGPRPIDIDVLLFGEQVIKQSDLIIPHEKMLQRRFVLEPLLEISPQVNIPGCQNAHLVLEELSDQACEKVIQ